MSELKSYDLIDIQDYRGEVYLKSEADKVIADLEESHKMEVEQLLMEIMELKDMAVQYKVLYKEKCRDINTQERFFAEERAHNKHKRCLAMAKYCHDRWNMSLGWDSADGKTADFFLHYKKWEKRWLALADKFKEVK